MNLVFKTIVLSLSVLSFNAHAATIPEIKAIPYPKATYGTSAHKKLIQRGEYLTKMGDCITCHTDAKCGGAPFAGGRGIQTPFGTVYSQNITPDKDTGIGNWNDQEFIRAMQHGVSPHGYPYFPVFPYTSFTRVTQDDLLAIKAYLLSIPPIHKSPPKNEIVFPFSWRFLQHGWKLLFFDPYKGVYQYNPKQSADWNRGAYIVQGLGHCGECHTPRNLFGAMKHKYALTGAFIEGYYAANITAQGLEGMPSQAVVEVFTKNKKYKGTGKVGGSMLAVNLDSLRYMTQSDLKAIVIYLKTIQSKEPEMAKKTAILGMDAGEAIYTAHCGICHDSNGAGAPKLGDAIDWNTRLKQGMPTIIMHTINGYNSMPARGGCMNCSDGEIKAAIDYIYGKSKSPVQGTVGTTHPKVIKPTFGLPPISHQMYQLNIAVFWICVAIFAIVSSVLFYSLFMHRKSRKHQASQFHKHPLLEIVWEIIPFLLIIALAVPATLVLMNLEIDRPSVLTTHKKCDYELL